MTDGECTLLWWGPGCSQWAGGEVGWAECRDEVRFLQELLTGADTPQPQAEGAIPSRRCLGSSDSHARSGQITSPFSLSFPAPQEDV